MTDADTDAAAAAAAAAAARNAVDTERAAALRRIEALSAEFDEIVAAAADANGDDEHDPEGATIAFERARVSGLRLEALGYLDELDRAVERLDAGTYGLCAHCGSPITPDRLLALPATRTCIACAASRR